MKCKVWYCKKCKDIINPAYCPGSGEESHNDCLKEIEVIYIKDLIKLRKEVKEIILGTEGTCLSLQHICNLINKKFEKYI